MQTFKEHLKDNYSERIQTIREKVKNYLLKFNIKNLTIGISGGLDSGVNAALLRTICDEIGISLIGVYIHIESNTVQEKDRAEKIGKAFCHSYQEIDLTNLYYNMLNETHDTYVIKDRKTKIRLGNIKARLRMIWLRNLASLHNGLLVDNDNLTEHLLGFWTLDGDVGDITPLFNLYKTEVYQLAQDLIRLDNLNNERKEALQEVIDAIPTDGLGITSSDLEQIGAESYNIVDDILFTYLNNDEKCLQDYLFPTYGEEVVNNVLNRYKNSDFKRHHPYRVI